MRWRKDSGGFRPFLRVRHGGHAPGVGTIGGSRDHKFPWACAAGRRDCVHMHLSKPECFIRFVGNGLHPTDYTRCDEWIDRIAKWADMGLQSVWFFMHQHDERYSPELADYVVEKLNERLGLSLLRPTFMDRDKGLF